MGARAAGRCAGPATRGYRYPRVRRWLARHGVKCVIPYWRGQNPDDGRHRFDREAYRRRAETEGPSLPVSRRAGAAVIAVWLVLAVAVSYWLW